MMNFFRWVTETIITLYQKLIFPVYDFIIRSVKYFFSLLQSFWDIVKDSLLYMFVYLGQLLENLFIKLSNEVFENILKLISWALEKILPPEGVESFSQTVDDMRTILAAFDVFLPIHEMFGYIGILITAWITSIVIRIMMMLVLRLILLFL